MILFHIAFVVAVLFGTSLVRKAVRDGDYGQAVHDGLWTAFGMAMMIVVFAQQPS